MGPWPAESPPSFLLLYRDLDGFERFGIFVFWEIAVQKTFFFFEHQNKKKIYFSNEFVKILQR